MSFNITPVASGYQEIHPYSAMNIDSVKINTSLIMMEEWPRPIQLGDTVWKFNVWTWVCGDFALALIF